MWNPFRSGGKSVRRNSEFNGIHCFAANAICVWKRGKSAHSSQRISTYLSGPRPNARSSFRRHDAKRDASHVIRISIWVTSRQIAPIPCTSISHSLVMVIEYTVEDIETRLIVTFYSNIYRNGCRLVPTSLRRKWEKTTKNAIHLHGVGR